MDKIKKYWKLPVSAMYAGAAVAAVLFYIFGPSAAYFHSDCTDTIMWAQASVESGKLFDPDFGYAAMLPFGGTAIMIPLVSLLGTTMKSHQIGMAIFTLIMFLSVWFVCRSGGLSNSKSLFAVGTFALVASSSEKFREIFYEHSIYYSISVVIIFFLLGLCMRLYDRSKDGSSMGKFAVLTALAFMLCCFGALDGMQMIASGIVPVVFAIAAYMLFNTEDRLFSKSNKGLIFFAFVVVCGTVAGLVALSSFSKDVTAGYADAYSTWSTPTEWITNANKLPDHWFSLFGLDTQKGESLISLKSVIRIIGIAGGLVIALVPVIALFFYKKLQPKTKMVLMTHIGVTGIIMFGYIFGILSAANWRLTPIICTGLIATIFVINEMNGGMVVKRMAFLAICTLIATGMVGMKSVYNIRGMNITNNAKYAITQYLKGNNLTYGYATFWNCQTITLLSDSEVVCSNVQIDNEGIQKSEYQTSRKRFEDQDGVDRYFVLVSEEEYEALKTNILWNITEAYSEQFETEGYRIFVFDSTRLIFTK